MPVKSFRFLSAVSLLALLSQGAVSAGGAFADSGSGGILCLGSGERDSGIGAAGSGLAPSGDPGGGLGLESLAGGSCAGFPLAPLDLSGGLGLPGFGDLGSGSAPGGGFDGSLSGGALAHEFSAGDGSLGPSSPGTVFRDASGQEASGTRGTGTQVGTVYSCPLPVDPLSATCRFEALYTGDTVDFTTTASTLQSFNNNLAIKGRDGNWRNPIVFLGKNVRAEGIWWDSDLRTTPLTVRGQGEYHGRAWQTNDTNAKPGLYLGDYADTIGIKNPANNNESLLYNSLSFLVDVHLGGQEDFFHGTVAQGKTVFGGGSKDHIIMNHTNYKWLGDPHNAYFYRGIDLHSGGTGHWTDGSTTPPSTMETVVLLAGNALSGPSGGTIRGHLTTGKAGWGNSIYVRIRGNWMGGRLQLGGKYTSNSHRGSWVEVEGAMTGNITTHQDDGWDGRDHVELKNGGTGSLNLGDGNDRLMITGGTWTGELIYTEKGDGEKKHLTMYIGSGGTMGPGSAPEMKFQKNATGVTGRGWDRLTGAGTYDRDLRYRYYRNEANYINHKTYREGAIAIGKDPFGDWDQSTAADNLSAAEIARHNQLTLGSDSTTCAATGTITGNAMPNNGKCRFIRFYDTDDFIWAKALLKNMWLEADDRYIDDEQITIPSEKSANRGAYEEYYGHNEFNFTEDVKGIIVYSDGNDALRVGGNLSGKVWFGGGENTLEVDGNVTSAASLDFLPKNDHQSKGIRGEFGFSNITIKGKLDTDIDLYMGSFQDNNKHRHNYIPCHLAPSQHQPNLVAHCTKRYRTRSAAGADPAGDYVSIGGGSGDVHLGLYGDDVFEVTAGRWTGSLMANDTATLAGITAALTGYVGHPAGVYHGISEGHKAIIISGGEIAPVAGAASEKIELASDDDREHRQIIMGKGTLSRDVSFADTTGTGYTSNSWVGVYPEGGLDRDETTTGDNPTAQQKADAKMLTIAAHIDLGNGKNTVHAKSFGAGGAITGGTGHEEIVFSSGSLAGTTAGAIIIGAGGTEDKDDDDDDKPGPQVVQIGGNFTGTSITATGPTRVTIGGNYSGSVTIGGAGTKGVDIDGNAGGAINLYSNTSGSATVDVDGNVGGSITTGPGVDSVTVDGTVTGNISTGEGSTGAITGNNTVTWGIDVGGVTGYIATGRATDYIRVTGNVGGLINTQGGNDRVTVTGNVGSINTGTGYDIINVGGNTGNITASSGGDLINVTGNTGNITATSSDDETITVGGNAGRIQLGGGNHTVTVSGTITGGIQTHTGGGNDTFTFHGGTGHLEMGTGTNRVTIPSGTWSMSRYANNGRVITSQSPTNSSVSSGNLIIRLGDGVRLTGSVSLYLKHNDRIYGGSTSSPVSMGMAINYTEVPATVAGQTYTFGKAGTINSNTDYLYMTIQEGGISVRNVDTLVAHIHQQTGGTIYGGDNADQIYVKELVGGRMRLRRGANRVEIGTDLLSSGQVRAGVDYDRVDIKRDFNGTLELSGGGSLVAIGRNAGTSATFTGGAGSESITVGGWSAAAFDLKEGPGNTITIVSMIGGSIRADGVDTVTIGTITGSPPAFTPGTGSISGEIDLGTSGRARRDTVTARELRADGSIKTGNAFGTATAQEPSAGGRDHVKLDLATGGAIDMRAGGTFSADKQTARTTMDLVEIAGNSAATISASSQTVSVVGDSGVASDVTVPASVYVDIGSNSTGAISLGGGGNVVDIGGTLGASLTISGSGNDTVEFAGGAGSVSLGGGTDSLKVEADWSGSYVEKTGGNATIEVPAGVTISGTATMYLRLGDTLKGLGTISRPVTFRAGGGASTLGEAPPPGGGALTNSLIVNDTLNLGDGGSTVWIKTLTAAGEITAGGGADAIVVIDGASGKISLGGGTNSLAITASSATTWAGSGGVSYQGSAVTAGSGVSSDTVSIDANTTVTGSMSFGSGAGAFKGAGTVSGAVTFGGGNDTIGDFGATPVASDNRLVLGSVSLGGGTNKVKADRITSLSAGSGADTVILTPTASFTLGTLNPGGGLNSLSIAGRASQAAVATLDMSQASGASDYLILCNEGASDIGACLDDPAVEEGDGHAFKAVLDASGTGGNTWEYIDINNQPSSAASELTVKGDVALGLGGGRSNLEHFRLKADGTAGDSLSFGGQIAIKAAAFSGGSPTQTTAGALFELDFSPGAGSGAGAADSLEFTAGSTALAGATGVTTEPRLMLSAVGAATDTATEGSAVALASVHSASAVTEPLLYDPGNLDSNLTTPTLARTVAVNGQMWTLRKGEAGAGGLTPWNLVAGQMVDAIQVDSTSGNIQRGNLTGSEAKAFLARIFNTGGDWRARITAADGDLDDDITINYDVNATGSEDWDLKGGDNALRSSISPIGDTAVDSGGNPAVAMINARVKMGDGDDTVGGARDDESRLRIAGGVELGGGANSLRASGVGRRGVTGGAITAGAGQDTVEVSGSVEGGVNLGGGANTFSAGELRGGYIGLDGVDTVRIGSSAEGEISTGGDDDTLFMRDSGLDSNGNPRQATLSGKVTLGAGDDLVGGSRQSGDLSSATLIWTAQLNMVGGVDLGEGMNTMTAASSGAITGGGGDDWVLVGGDVSGNVDLKGAGTGENFFWAQGNLGGSYTGLDDADTVNVGGGISGGANLGGGANTLSAGSLGTNREEGDIYVGGDGADTVTVAGAVHGHVRLGGGANSFSAGGDITGDVVAGDGGNTLTTTGGGSLLGDYTGGSGLDMLTIAGTVGHRDTSTTTDAVDFTVDLKEGSNSVTASSFRKVNYMGGDDDDTIGVTGIFLGEADLKNGANVFRAGGVTGFVGGGIDGDDIQIGTVKDHDSDPATPEIFVADGGLLTSQTLNLMGGRNVFKAGSLKTNTANDPNATGGYLGGDGYDEVDLSGEMQGGANLGDGENIFTAGSLAAAQPGLRAYLGGKDSDTVNVTGALTGGASLGEGANSLVAQSVEFPRIKLTDDDGNDVLDDEGEPVLVRDPEGVSGYDGGDSHDTVTVSGAFEGDADLKGGENRFAAGGLDGGYMGGASFDEVEVTNAITGSATLGDGQNSLEAGSLMGDYNGGADADTVTIAGALMGEANLGAGTNALSAGSLMGAYTGGAGADTVEVTGRIASAVSLGDGINILRAGSLVTNVRDDGQGAAGAAEIFDPGVVMGGAGSDIIIIRPSESFKIGTLDLGATGAGSTVNQVTVVGSPDASMAGKTVTLDMTGAGASNDELLICGANARDTGSRTGCAAPTTLDGHSFSVVLDTIVPRDPADPGSRDIVREAFEDVRIINRASGQASELTVRGHVTLGALDESDQTDVAVLKHFRLKANDSSGDTLEFDGKIAIEGPRFSSGSAEETTGGALFELDLDPGKYNGLGESDSLVFTAGATNILAASSPNVQASDLLTRNPTIRIMEAGPGGFANEGREVTIARIHRDSSISGVNLLAPGGVSDSDTVTLNEQTWTRSYGARGADGYTPVILTAGPQPLDDVTIVSTTPPVDRSQLVRGARAMIQGEGTWPGAFTAATGFYNDLITIEWSMSASGAWILGNGNNSIAGKKVDGATAATISGLVTAGVGYDIIGGETVLEDASQLRFAGGLSLGDGSAGEAENRVRALELRKGAFTHAVLGGGGRDVIEVSGAVIGGVDLRGGANELRAGSLTGDYTSAGDSADTIVVSGAVIGDVNPGGGANFLKAGSLDGDYTGGEGADTVELDAELARDINLRGGANTLKAARLVGSYTGGGQADTIDTEGAVGAEVDMGNGENRLMAGSLRAKYTGGENQDTVVVTGAVAMGQATETALDMKGGPNELRAQSLTGIYLGGDDADTISLSGAAAGDLRMGGGRNFASAESITGDITGGDGRDRVEALGSPALNDNPGTPVDETLIGMIMGTVSLGGGDNTLTAASLAGSYTGLGGADRIEVSGAIDGALNLGGGANTVMAATLSAQTEITGGSDVNFTDAVILRPSYGGGDAKSFVTQTYGSIDLGTGQNLLKISGSESDATRGAFHVRLGESGAEGDDDRLMICNEDATANTTCDASETGEAFAFSVILDASGAGAGNWEAVQIINQPSFSRSELNVTGEVTLQGPGQAAKLEHFRLVADQRLHSMDEEIREAESNQVKSSSIAVAAGDKLVFAGPIAIKEPQFSSQGLIIGGAVFELDLEPGANSGAGAADMLEFQATATTIQGLGGLTTTPTVEIVFSESRKYANVGAKVTIAQVATRLASVTGLRLQNTLAGRQEQVIDFNGQKWTLESDREDTRVGYTTYSLVAALPDPEEILITPESESVDRSDSDVYPRYSAVTISGGVWGGQFTASETADLNDFITVNADSGGTGVWTLGGGADRVQRAGEDTSLAVAAISGLVSLGAGDDRVGGLLVSEHSDDMTQGEKEAEARKSLLAMASVRLGEGSNAMRAASVTASAGSAITGGSGADMVAVEGAVIGDVELGGGENSLSAGSLSGKYTGGSAADTVMVDGQIVFSGGAGSSAVNMLGGENKLTAGGLLGGYSGGAGNDTVTLAGVVVGDIKMGGGDNSLEIDGEWTGAYSGGSGRDLIQLQAGGSATVTGLDFGGGSASANSLYVVGKSGGGGAGKITLPAPEGTASLYFCSEMANPASRGCADDAAIEDAAYSAELEGGWDSVFISNETSTAQSSLVAKGGVTLEDPKFGNLALSGSPERPGDVITVSGDYHMSAGAGGETVFELHLKSHGTTGESAATDKGADRLAFDEDARPATGSATVPAVLIRGIPALENDAAPVKDVDKFEILAAAADSGITDVTLLRSPGATNTIIVNGYFWTMAREEDGDGNAAYFLTAGEESLIRIVAGDSGWTVNGDTPAGANWPGRLSEYYANFIDVSRDPGAQGQATVWDYAFNDPGNTSFGAGGDEIENYITLREGVRATGNWSLKTGKAFITGGGSIEGTVTLGDGDDSIGNLAAGFEAAANQLEIAGDLNLGGGSNTVKARSASAITLGDDGAGDNEIRLVEAKGSVTLGAGDDVLGFAGIAAAARVSMGAGDNMLVLEDESLAPDGAQSETRAILSYEGGDGDDAIIMTAGSRAISVSGVSPGGGANSIYVQGKGGGSSLLGLVTLSLAGAEGDADTIYLCNEGRAEIGGCGNDPDAGDSAYRVMLDGSQGNSWEAVRVGNRQSSERSSITATGDVTFGASEFGNLRIMADGSLGSVTTVTGTYVIEDSTDGSSGTVFELDVDTLGREGSDVLVFDAQAKNGPGTSKEPVVEIKPRDLGGAVPEHRQEVVLARAHVSSGIDRINVLNDGGVITTNDTPFNLNEVPLPGEGGDWKTGFRRPAPDDAEMMRTFFIRYTKKGRVDIDLPSSESKPLEAGQESVVEFFLDRGQPGEWSGTFLLGQGANPDSDILVQDGVTTTGDWTLDRGEHMIKGDGDINGKVTLGPGNDTIGNFASGAPASENGLRFGMPLDLGHGNNRLKAASLAGLKAGRGSDTVEVGSVTGNVDLGQGKNTLQVDGGVDGDMAGGDGMDEFRVLGALAGPVSEERPVSVTGSVSLGSGRENNILEIAGAIGSGSIVSEGSGMDTVSFAGGLGNVSLGDGSNRVVISGDWSGTYIEGSDADIIELRPVGSSNPRTCASSVTGESIDTDQNDTNCDGKTTLSSPSLDLRAGDNSIMGEGVILGSLVMGSGDDRVGMLGDEPQSRLELREVNLGSGDNEMRAISVTSLAAGSGSDTIHLRPARAMSLQDLNLGMGRNRMFIEGREGDPSGRKITLSLSGGPVAGAAHDYLYICGEVSGANCNPGDTAAFDVTLDASGGNVWETVRVANSAKDNSHESRLSISGRIVATDSQLGRITVGGNGAAGDELILAGSYGITAETMFELDVDTSGLASDVLRLEDAAAMRSVGYVKDINISLRGIPDRVSAARGEQVVVFTASASDTECANVRIEGSVCDPESQAGDAGMVIGKVALNGQDWEIKYDRDSKSKNLKYYIEVPGGDEPSGPSTPTPADPATLPTDTVTWQDVLAASSSMLAQTASSTIQLSHPRLAGPGVSQSSKPAAPFFWTQLTAGKESERLMPNASSKYESSFQFAHVGAELFKLELSETVVSHSVFAQYGIIESREALESRVSGVGYRAQVTSASGLYASMSATSSKGSTSAAGSSDADADFRGSVFSAEGGQIFAVNGSLTMSLMGRLSQSRVSDVKFKNGDALTDYQRTSGDIGLQVSHASRLGAGRIARNLFGGLSFSQDFKSSVQYAQSGKTPTSIDSGKAWAGLSFGISLGTELSAFYVEASAQEATGDVSAARQSFTIGYDLNW